MAETTPKTDKLPSTDRGWQAWIQNQKPPEERRWVAMGGGLTIALETSGAKVFQARIRRIGDAHARRIALGHFPTCSVAEARQRLAEARAAAKEGRDPALDRRRAREGIQQAATLGALIDRYLERRIESGRLRHKTLAIETQALQTLRRALGDRLLSDLEARDFAAVVEREAVRLRKAGRTGRAANISLAAAKRMFKDAQGRGEVATSPVANLKRPAEERPRDRILYDGRVLFDLSDREKNETGAIVRALRSKGPVRNRSTRIALLLTLMFGMRVGDVAALQWSTVRLDDELPTFAVLKGKTAAATRTLPLPKQAVALLRELRDAADANQKYLFPAAPHARRAEHLHPESVSQAFDRVCAELKIADVTIHDVRRTCLSGLVELTGDESLARRIAGQKDQSTLSRHYDRSRRLEAMHRALSLWADALDAAAEGI